MNCVQHQRTCLIFCTTSFSKFHAFFPQFLLPVAANRIAAIQHEHANSQNIKNFYGTLPSSDTEIQWRSSCAHMKLELNMRFNPIPEPCANIDSQRPSMATIRSRSVIAPFDLFTPRTRLAGSTAASRRVVEAPPSELPPAGDFELPRTIRMNTCGGQANAISSRVSIETRSANLARVLLSRFIRNRCRT